MSEEVISDVPSQKLEETVRRAREACAIRIVIDKNPNGTFNVVVTFP